MAEGVGYEMSRISFYGVFGAALLSLLGLSSLASSSYSGGFLDGEAYEQSYAIGGVSNTLEALCHRITIPDSATSWACD